MEKPLNPLQVALVDRGVALPNNPIDFSPLFEAAGVGRRYIISMTGRCGSTWLASALAQIPNCGKPLEYFSNESIPYFGSPDGSGSLAQYMESVVVATKTDSVFGVKIDGMRMDWLSTICDIGRSFPPFQTPWIDMRRMNVVKQAFSFGRAKKSGIWHNFADQPDTNASLEVPSNEISTSKAVQPKIGDAVIWREILRLVAAERALDDMYASLQIHPLRIVYEELLDSKPFLLMRVLGHLFPKRNFSVNDVSIPDRTRKLSSVDGSPDEIAFMSRHARAINVVQDYRGDRSLSLSELRTFCSPFLIDS